MCDIFNFFKVKERICSFGKKAKLLYYLSQSVKLKINNRSTRTRCEICSKLTRKTTKRCHFGGHFGNNSASLIVNFKYILHFALLFRLLTMNMQYQQECKNFLFCCNLIKITIIVKTVIYILKKSSTNFL